MSLLETGLTCIAPSSLLNKQIQSGEIAGLDGNRPVTANGVEASTPRPTAKRPQMQRNQPFHRHSNPLLLPHENASIQPNAEMKSIEK